MTAPMIGTDDRARQEAKDRARQMIAEGTITSPDELKQFMASQGVNPKPSTRSGFADKREPPKQEGLLAKGSRLLEKGLQGLSSNFFDEYVGSMILPNDPKGGAQFMRDRMAETDRMMPVAGAAAEMIGGGLQSTLPFAAGPRALATAGKIATKVPGVLRGVAGGALGGAVAGAGAAEGDAADRGLGALMGGTLGAGVGGLFQGAGAGIRLGRNLMTKNPQVIQNSADNVMEELAQAATSKDGGFAELLRLRSQGLDARPVDVLGQQGRRTMAAIRTKAGGAAEEASTALTARQRDLSDNLADAITTAAKMGERPNPVQMAEDIMARRQAAADVLYAKMRANGKVVDTPEVRAQFAKPQMRELYQKAQELAALGDKPPLPNLYDADGNLVQAPTVEVIDRLKRLGIDDAIDAGRNPATRKKTAVADSWQSVKDKLLAAADEADPDYKLARQEYAGDSEMLDALELGKGVVTKSGNVVLSEIKKLSPSELEMYKAGALGDILDTIGKTRGKGDPSLRWDTPETRKKLQALFPGEEYAKIQQALKDVNTLSSTFGSIGGSPTQPLQQQGEEFLRQMGTTAADMARGNIGIPLARQFGNMVARASRGTVGEVGERVTRDLMADPAAYEAQLRRIGQRRAGQPIRALQDILKAGGAGSAITSQFGN